MKEINIYFVDEFYHWKTSRYWRTPQITSHPHWRRTPRTSRRSHLHSTRKYPSHHLELPDKLTHPNLHYWYLFLSNFTASVITAWTAKQNKKAGKKEKKPEPKKEEEEEFDPFADDDTPAKEPVKPAAPKPAAKPKAKVIAKSIVVFDVKIYDMEATNLD